jgi:PKD repeat protein
MQGATSLVVTTEPYTYVAISKDNVLLDADWSGSGTSVTLTVPSFTGETYCIVGTKQDRAPYINESVVPTVASPPVAAFSGTPTTILEGQSVTFTNTSQNAATSSWDFGDTQTSTEVNPVHVYTTAGTYTVSLTVTNTLGNDNETKTDYITVNLNTNPPTAQFSASATTVMVGGSVNFTDLSTNNPASWAWTFQGASPASSTAQNPTGITYPNAGVYSVTLTVTNTYGNDSEVKTGYITVTVPDYCDAYAESEDEYISNFTFNTINQNSTWSTGGYGDYTNVSTTVLRESSYNLSVTNAINYRYDEVIVWIDYNMNGDFTDAGEQVFAGPYTGTTTSNPYTWTGSVTIPATATLGTTRMRVRLNYDSDTYDGNSTPCGMSGYGEVEDYSIVITSPTTAIGDVEKLPYSVYPNPAKDFVMVYTYDEIALSIEVVNVVGQVLTQISPDSENTQIDLGNLEAGIYFVKVKTGGREFSQKIVVK